MNVVLNGRFLSRRITGVERFAHEILSRSCERLRVVRSGRWGRGVIGHAWEQFILPGRVHAGEILWSPANLGPLAVAEQVLTLHDLSPLENPGWFKPNIALWYRMLVPLLVRRVRIITVPSAYVRERIMRYFHLADDRVTVVQGGVDLDRFTPLASPLDGLPKRYILFVGSVQPRKNLKRLLQAWKKICYRFPDVWLLAAGGDQGIFQRDILPVDLERFRWLGYVADADLPGLYANAELFVMPSLDEGFGLPILEAMACGTAVLAAQAGALPEIAGQAAIFFNPEREDKLAEQLDLCIRDTGLRHSLVEKGWAQAQRFSWDVSVSQLWEVIRKCR